MDTLMDQERNKPGTTATVLRARNTLKVLRAATFPNLMNIVMYLQGKHD